MKDFLRAVFVLVFIVVTSAVSLGDVAAPLSEKQQKNLEGVLSVLLSLYDDDVSLIPSDPNAIIALEVSENPRDQVAWRLFKFLRHITDPNAIDPAKESSLVPNREEIQTKTLEDSEPVVTTSFLASPENGTEMRYAAAEAIEDLENPLGSCILAPKTYRILSLPLTIEGHVVMPAGVRLIAPFDPNSNIIEVMPGGLLETGCAAFYSDEDCPSVLPLVEIVPEDPNVLFNHNNVGVFVHRGADPKTRLENLEISGCRIGIIIDEQLNYPISRVLTFGCYDGIHLYAPAGIIDSEFWYNGSVYDGLFGYVGAGIYVWLNWESNPQPEVTIQQTTLYGADVGLFIEGGNADPNVSEPNQVVPSVNVVNSCFAAGNFYGLYQSSGDALMDVQYSAFGGNYEHTNVYLPYTGCIELSSNPFYTLGEGKRLYVYPGSEMVDAGYGMAEDGMGTAHNWPDTGQMDIGSHFPIGVTGSFGFPSSPADFNWDGIVDELDLELMEMCMGAITDPNIAKIDGNYDSRVNLPDFAWFAFDYGYCGDPNESGNNDPNCRRSDFDGDDRVDIADLALLSEYWLTVVTGEYRLCDLCDLYDDPNAPNAIDANDMNAFMADWGVQSSFDPNIVIEQSASMLSVAVENPDPAWKISAFFDDELIGQWEAGSLGSTAFDVDLTRYGPGSHCVKIVRNIEYGFEITEQVVTDPNSTGLYFANIPDAFEPNEPYSVSGFNLGDELNIKIKDIYEQSIYDVNVPSGEVNLEIPSETFDEAIVATFSASAAATPADEGRYKKLLKQKFDPNDWEGRSVRVVFLLPDAKVRKIYWQAVCSAIKAVENQGLTYVVLTEYDVNQNNFHFLFRQMQGRRIVIYFGHANSYVENVQRTHFQCFLKSTIMKPGAFYDLGAVSYTRNSMAGAIPLPYYQETPQPVSLDNYAFDIKRYVPECKIDKMFVFGCLSAIYEDMATVQGCGSLHDHATGDMLYVGLRLAVLQANGGWVEGIGDNFIRGLSIFFDQLGQDDSSGEPRTIWRAIQAIQAEGGGIRTQCLGFNGFYDVNPPEADHQALGLYGVQALSQKLY